MWLRLSEAAGEPILVNMDQVKMVASRGLNDENSALYWLDPEGQSLPTVVDQSLEEIWAMIEHHGCFSPHPQ
jgi:hypothetical protein